MTTMTMTIPRRSGLSVLPSFLAGYCQTVISISPIPSDASMSLSISICFLGGLQDRSFLRDLCLWASENVNFMGWALIIGVSLFSQKLR